MSNPWGKFFWSDWESDPALRLCSFAAQGLWMRMLCIAASHDPIGYVAVNGRGLDAPAIARMSGGSEPEVSALIDELDRNGVFSRDRNGRIYSRRMIRDAKLSKKRSESGREGAAVTNSKRNEKSDLPQQNPGKPSANGSAKVRPQKPEARDQKDTNLPPVIMERRARKSRKPVECSAFHRIMACFANGSIFPTWNSDRDILPVVRRVAERVRQSGGRTPFKFRLFDQAIREQQAADQAEIERLRRARTRIEETDRQQREDDAERVSAGGSGRIKTLNMLTQFPTSQKHRPSSSVSNPIGNELAEEASYDVFRCRPSKTMETANRLSRLGVNTWIPISRHSVRVGKGRPVVMRSMPILPSYLFVETHHAFLVDRLTDELRVSGVAPMHFNGKRVWIDGARLVVLDPARRGERKRKAVPASPWHADQRVTIDSGAAIGMVGSIRKLLPSACRVEMDAGKMVTVPYFLLRSVRI